MPIIIDGTSTFDLDQFSCSEGFTAYNFTYGPAISEQDFTGTCGFDTTCDYNGGTLPVEEFILNKTLNIFKTPYDMKKI